jgi:lactate dehydrogenase-like 2-hydroxyacid dehydrogenase
MHHDNVEAGFVSKSPSDDSERRIVHVSGPIPMRVTEALAEQFLLRASPQGAEGILALTTTRIDDAYLADAGPQLRVVANYGVGVDNVDLVAARSRGILVTNTPDVLTDTVAELTITLALSLLRRVVEGDRFLRRGAEWSFSLEFMLGTSLRGKTFGIVGPGRIGRATASLAEALGAQPAFAGRDDDLCALLRSSDVVSLHCPLTPSTHHLINAETLACMRPSAILINTSRGPVVAESDLIDALKEGIIAGAALDVFEREPAFSSHLREFENVVLTPHIGSATRHTRESMGMLAVEALRSVLIEGQQPHNVVA